MFFLPLRHLSPPTLMQSASHICGNMWRILLRRLLVWCHLRASFPTHRFNSPTPALFVELCFPIISCCLLCTFCCFSWKLVLSIVSVDTLDCIVCVPDWRGRLTCCITYRSGKGKDPESGSLTRVTGSLCNLSHQLWGRYGLCLAQKRRDEHCAGKSLSLCALLSYMTVSQFRISLNFQNRCLVKMSIVKI